MPNIDAHKVVTDGQGVTKGNAQVYSKALEHVEHAELKQILMCLVETLHQTLSSSNYHDKTLFICKLSILMIYTKYNW